MTGPASTGLAARKAAFVQLGLLLGQFARLQPWPDHACGLTQQEYAAFDEALKQAHVRNGWFTEPEVRHALQGLAAMLDASIMEQWLAAYPRLEVEREVRAIGIIMAGNVPFVGFHDLFCVLLCGHSAKVKPASDDAGLMTALLAMLSCFAPELAAKAELVPGKLGAMDALIATGSNNTARYFEHYFGNVPRIVRKGRCSVALLDGTESDAELDALGEDVFRYFGLGCRNVGKVFIPQEFSLDRLFGAFFRWKDIINHHKYANNYDYNKAVWLMDRVPITENGFLLMKEDDRVNSPVAALLYERYVDRGELEAKLDAMKDELQCIVGHGHLPFGTAQCPGPGEYADNVDTMQFLLELA
ncbi:MAG: acyl-CoA reductase [Bacteroidetes bacterium]|nr:acyl-CoA reductase [Bacteroidota bacterium]